VSLATVAHVGGELGDGREQNQITRAVGLPGAVQSRFQSRRFGITAQTLVVRKFSARRRVKMCG
jgi:hypothetical protein